MGSWRGGGPLSSQVLFSCSAHVLCMGLLCIFQGPSGLAVYKYTHTHILDGTFSLQSTALYGVGENLTLKSNLTKYNTFLLN